MKMKTAIVLFLYAARSLAEDPIDDCSVSGLLLLSPLFSTRDLFKPNTDQSSDRVVIFK